MPDYVRDIMDEFEAARDLPERRNKEEVWQEINDHVVPNRIKTSRLWRMAGLWVDAKENDLKRRAKPD